MAKTEIEKSLTIRSELSRRFGDKLEYDKDLSQFSSFRTGGRADYFIAATSPADLARSISAAHDTACPFFVIGGGSNLLISDRGFRGLIIKVAVTGLEVIGQTGIHCGAGVELIDLVRFATQHSLTGLEFAAGIWGTVGGAIYGNAGAYGGEIKDVLTEVTLVDRNAVIKTVEPDYCRFGYRDSALKRTGEVVIEAKFVLTPGNRAEIADRVEEILHVRAAKHPVEGKSAGCFFKNIPDPKEKFGKLPAGRLLEEAGAKELSLGGARVFDKHANMIVNTGTATSADIRRLSQQMKALVEKKFGISLEEEVILVGEFD